MTDPKVSPIVVRAHPEQTMSSLWRWGPVWQDERGEGIWAIDRIFRVGVRILTDPAEPLVSWQYFTTLLDDARDWERRKAEDTFLESLTPKPAAKRAPRGKRSKMAAAVESQLDEILRSA